ncbi:MAG: M20/M25/M40 family metallo-hydrolase [Nocardiopsaceae bacterium]|nr:M20/M25/M40 family metallo-hydrolase [Nocardiopsaceae bacterium]
MLPHLVLVGARPEIVGKMLGVPVVVSLISRTGTDDAFERKIATRVVSTDITDPDALLACARRLHAWRPIDAMLAATEHALLPTALVGEALGVRVNPVDAVRLAQDKAGMRQRLADKGLPTAAFRVCAGPGEVAEFFAEHPAGVVLKPADGNGGRGVWLIRDRADIDAAWAHAAGESTAAGVLAEELISGLELSAETMSADGEHQVLVIPAKHTSGPPHFVEIAHEIPGGHPATVERAAADAALAALSAIGHAWGPTNTEVIVHGEHATVVEVNPRWGGARYWEMIELAVGVDMARACAMALCYGELPGSLRVPRRSYAVRLLAPPPGRIVSVTGVDAATALDGVIRVGELNRIGDVVPVLTDFRGRTGYVLATAPDPDAARAIAADGAERIVMHTIPARAESSAKAKREGTEAMSEDVRAAIQELLPSVRSDLADLVRIPSVSADPGRAADVGQAAAHTARLFTETGAASVQMIDDIPGSPPTVLARYPAPPGMPTVLLYAHYDVQPTGDLGLWSSPPFEPVERDGRLYGRGTADDKAGIAAHLAALRFFGGRPPVGVTVVVEGEEEIGSPGLAAFIERYRDELTADVIVLADSVNAAAGQPALTTTLRGLTDCVVEVSALRHGVHSGVFGGAAPDALTALCRLLATLHDDSGRVAIKGLGTADTVASGHLDYPVDRFRRDSGVLDGVPLLGTGSIAERIWAGPAVAVVAIDATPVQEASNTLASSARAKVSLRVPPGDDAVGARDKLLAHLKEHAPWGTRVTVTPGPAGQPFVIDTAGPAFDVVRQAFTEAYRTPVSTVGQGGSIPFIAEFARAFPAAAIAVTSAGADPDARIHGVDEGLLLADFADACVGEALLLIGLARQHDKAQPARAI